MISQWSFKKTFFTGLAAFFTLFLAFSFSAIVEDVPGKKILVVQYPYSGKQVVFTQPGLAMQWFGTITYYSKRVQYSFNKGCKAADDNAFPAERIRFAEGGHADLCGSISWEMPTDTTNILRLHNEFGSEEAIERQLIGKALQSAIYLSGQTMSSAESSGPRRSELFNYVNDQTLNGLYQTSVKVVERIDPVTKAASSMTVSEIKRDDKGMPVRLQGSAVGSYGLTLLPLNISELAYEKSVSDQIQLRQTAVAQVEISAANARRAEQEAVQAEQEGRKKATTAKWAQEEKNATLQADAEQKLRSQELATKTAEAYKKEQTLRGEGDAAYKRAVMEADGALDPKLKAYVEVNAKYAEAIQKYGGAWVPTVTMGGEGGGRLHPL